MNIFECIVDWGFEKNIVSKENATKQLLKSVEELGEFIGDYLKGKDIRNELGDFIVTMLLTNACIHSGEVISFEEVNKFADEDKSISTIEKSILNILSLLGDTVLDFYCIFYNIDNIAKLNGTTIEECAEMAYNKIMLRTGKNVNGVFVKD